MRRDQAQRDALIKERVSRATAHAAGQFLEWAKNPELDQRTWKDATIGQRAVFRLLDNFAAKERAKTAADAAPRQLGVVLVVPQIQDRGEWERFAQDTERGVIDAIPTSVIHGTRGTVGAVPAQLDQGVRLEPESQAPAEHEGEAGQEDPAPQPVTPGAQPAESMPDTPSPEVV